MPFAEALPRILLSIVGTIRTSKVIIARLQGTNYHKWYHCCFHRWAHRTRHSLFGPHFFHDWRFWSTNQIHHTRRWCQQIIHNTFIINMGQDRVYTILRLVTDNHLTFLQMHNSSSPIFMPPVYSVCIPDLLCALLMPVGRRRLCNAGSRWKQNHFITTNAFYAGNMCVCSPNGVEYDAGKYFIACSAAHLSGMTHISTEIGPCAVHRCRSITVFS